MPYDPRLYPPDWRERAAALKARVGCCEQCGAKPGEKRPNRRGELVPVILTVAHPDHNPHDPQARLAVWCAACHCRYDASHDQLFRRRHNMEVARGQLEFDL